MIVQPVLRENVHQVWGSVENFLSKALDFAKGDYNAEHAKVYLANGTWNLFVGVDESGDIKGACTVEFINRPNDRVAFVTAIGGRLISDPETFGNFKQVLKRYGATKIEGAARPSIKRLWESKFGFAEKYSIVEADL
jgi:hypothetical protein